MVEIREATAADLGEGTRLLAGALGFSERDAIPGWLVHDAQEAGALALVAAEDGRLAGFSLAIPALGAAGPHLLSCGLAVAAGLRSRGIGLRLKLAQREAALARGHELIRWRADPLNAPGIHLYLDKLGARLVGYAPDAYAGVRDDGPVPHDDVEIEWRLRGEPNLDGVRRRVEVPWDRAALDGEEALAWRLAVRGQARRALDSGGVGVAVDLDRSARRAWLCFEVPS